MPLKVLTCIEEFREYNQLLFWSQLAVNLYSKQKGAEKQNGKSKGIEDK